MSNFNEKWDKAEKYIPPEVTFHTIAPTLEDLVNVCQLKYNKKTPLQLFSLMRCQISSIYCDSFLHCQSMKELWLIFYMATFYSKKWADNKKEWVTDLSKETNCV